MTTTNHLNLLLSDILQSAPISTKEMYRESFNPTPSLLTFANEDCHPSITAIAPLPPPPRRSASQLKHRRQRQYTHQSDKANQQKTTATAAQPLLNSSTLDDLFRALTLECEQYLSASSYQNKIYDSLIIEPSKLIQTNMDSNDDDYENLHPSRSLLLNSLSPLKTSIQVASPEKRQVLSVSVSTKKSPSPVVPSSRTFPLLSTSLTSATMVSTNHRHSSEDDSIDFSPSSTIHRRRRRRIRKQPMISSIPHSSSSDDERIELINEKRSFLSKRSSSTDHRHQRIHSIYDNHPTSTPSHKFPSSRRTRHRDVSLQQQHTSLLTKPYEDIVPRFPQKSASPLSVLMTSTESASDFLDRSQRMDHQPLSLLDRMHHQLYRTSPTGHQNNIPTHRIPSYPVY